MSKPVALKEWAVAVKALLEGKQIIIMRKGGIAEETRDFQLQSKAFYLFPTYEHQKKHLIKDEYADSLDQTLQAWEPGQQTVPIACYAEAVEDFEVFDQAELDKLSGLHIWTDRFAEERLKWKRKNPLHVIALRVYALDEPQSIANLADYAGCTSWIELEEPLAAGSAAVGKPGGLKPVLDDEGFESRLAALKQALGR
ncbi:DUF1802 family protein [Paenibacillus sp. MBLB4367]|uniref:DUF1802 family protein n=1 Tax=Paenibacillus sp. MBLB4367 TaxID=3384767 RepID=UPI00390817A3